MRRPVVSTALNFLAQIAGAVLPGLLMVFTFPVMREALSKSAFATFIFLFTTTSFMSVLDAGLSRSVTFFVARYVRDGLPKEAIRSLWAAVALGLALSTTAAGLALLVGGYLWHGNATGGVDVGIVLKLLWFLPVYTCGSLLRGFLEAERRFLETNIVQLFYGISLAGIPLVLVRFTPSVSIYPLLFGFIRLGALLACLSLIYLSYGRTLLPDREVKTKLPQVLHYAKWLFASNILGIAIVYSDRIAVAARLSADLIAAYIVPMELVLRGQVLIGALSSVLFPVLVRAAARKSDLFIRGAVSMQMLLFGGALLFSVLASSFIPVLLDRWMGNSFSAQATLVARIAMVGLGPIACTNLAMTVINADGRTGPPAFLHVVEFPIYAIVLWVAVLTGQLFYIAAVWLGRLCLDMVGMQYIMLSTKKRGLSEWIAQAASVLLILAAYFDFAHISRPALTPLILLGVVGIVIIIAGGRMIRRTFMLPQLARLHP